MAAPRSPLEQFERDTRFVDPLTDLVVSDQIDKSLFGGPGEGSGSDDEGAPEHAPKRRRRA